MNFLPQKKTLKSLALATAFSVIAPMAIDGAAYAQVQRTAVGSERPQNFFEALFPNLVQQRLRRERALVPVETIKISAPKVYNYKAEKLVRMDLAPLTFVDTSAADETPQPQQAAVTADSGNEVATDPQPTGSISPEYVVETDFDRISRAFGELSIMAEPEISKAVSDHYSKNRELIWLDEELQPNARARSVVAVLQDADAVGLEATDYDVGFPQPDTVIDLMEAARLEIALTIAAIRYGMDASAGRVDPNKLSGYHDFPKNRADATAVIEEITSGGLPARKLKALNPDSDYFRALQTELSDIEQQSDGLIVIPAKTLIRPGDTHEQVPNILAAIARKGSVETAESAKAFLAQPEAIDTFTPEVVELVKAFQKEKSLGADGVVGPNTISKLTDVDPETKRERILFAMERLRWHPKDLGSRHVFINQPSYTARYVEDRKTELEMRVVVGKNSNQTSFFYDEIETVEYNPYWGIPRSILVNEYLPKLRANPAYLDERGYEVTDRKGRQISSASVDWYTVGAKPPYDVRQRPGKSNALGELKILFPNKHAIYMHDTPSRNLFNRSTRAFSHGCVRLHQPREMAAAVLGTSVDYIGSRIAGGAHASEDVPGNIPVYVAYFTAWPRDNGEVEYFADMYGRDGRLKKALEVTHAARAATS